MSKNVFCMHAYLERWWGSNSKFHSQICASLLLLMHYNFLSLCNMEFLQCSVEILSVSLWVERLSKSQDCSKIELNISVPNLVSVFHTNFVFVFTFLDQVFIEHGDVFIFRLWNSFSSLRFWKFEGSNEKEYSQTCL